VPGETVHHQQREEQDEAVAEMPPTDTTDTAVDLGAIDQLLDDIDEVLEVNAEQFAQEYQQRGGE